MINYNIPSVTTSVIDRSYLTTEKAGTRTPLIAGFSKFGEEDKYYQFSTSKEAEYKLGSLDFKKYGLGLLYLRDSLRKSNSAIFKRLMPSDATFANFSIDKDGNGFHYENIKNKSELLNIYPFFEIEPEDETSDAWFEWNEKKLAWQAEFEARQNLVLTHMAKGRGSAYSNIFIVYSPAPDYEKMDSNELGETNYKFNFVRADIYEQTPTGYVGIGDPIIFSLIDIDIDTNYPIVDQFVGLELFANVRVKESNDILTINVNEDHLPEIRQYRNIDDLMPDGRLIVPDDDNEVFEQPMFYEVKVAIGEDGLEYLQPIATDQLMTSNKLGYSNEINPFSVANSIKVKLSDIDVPEELDLDINNIEATSTDTAADTSYSTLTSIYTGVDASGAVNSIVVGSNKITTEQLSFSLAAKWELVDGTTFNNYTVDANGSKVIHTDFKITLPSNSTEKVVDVTLLNDIDSPADIVMMEFEIMSVIGVSGTNYDIDPKFHFYDFTNPTSGPNYLRVERNIPSDYEFTIYVDKALDNDVEIHLDLVSVSQSGVENTVPRTITLPAGVTELPINILALTADESVYLNIAKDIVVKNGVVIIKDNNYITEEEVNDHFYLDSEDSFYKLTYDFTNDELTFQKAKFLRQIIYEEIVGKTVKLFDGYDGERLFKPNTNTIDLGLPVSPSAYQNAADCLVQFYNDNTELRELLYPKYDFDYIPDWTEQIRVIRAIDSLTADINLTMGISSIPVSYDVNLTTHGQSDADIKIRKGQFDINASILPSGGSLHGSNFSMMYYSSQKNKDHIDPDTNTKLLMPTSYYALMNHLNIDLKYSITEPVANIEKGLLDTNRINLLYSPTSKEIEDLRTNQINAIIVEDETYIIDQLTSYKKASKLSRANIVKTIHRVRKDLPKVLKPYLQLKATEKIINETVDKTRAYMNQWLVTDENQKHGIFETIDITGVFNKDTNRLRISITVNPVGTIEIIDIPIIVV